MTVHGVIEPLLASHPLLVYPLTYISIIFIGNPASFAALWLAFEDRVGKGAMTGIIGLVLFADISGDLAWYWLGRSLRDTRLGNYLYRHIPHQKTIEKHVQKNAGKWVFLSKFIPSTTFAIIFSVGWAKTKFKKFFPVSLAAIASSLTVLTLLALGLARTFSSINAPAFFKRFERTFAIALILFIFLNFGIAKISKRYLERE